MKILVSNDDGVLAQGLWALVRELQTVGEVVVSAPDREQSAVGTAVTLRAPLRAHKVVPMLPGVETYAVEGTPGDSVILALEKLVQGVDLVVSGINNGLNLGDDVLISGTVGAALQGYLRGIPAMAVSLADARSPFLDNTARVAALLARKVLANNLPTKVFLNVNVPTLSLPEIAGIKVTRLASNSHIDTVDEGHDGKKEYYWLTRRKANHNRDDRTDIGAIARGLISVTALSPNSLTRPSSSTLETLCSGLLEGLQSQETRSGGTPCPVLPPIRADVDIP